MCGEQNSPPSCNPSPGVCVQRQGWVKGRAGWFLISAPPHRGQIPEEKRAEGELGPTRARVLTRSLEQAVERKRKGSCLTQAPTDSLTPLPTGGSWSLCSVASPGTPRGQAAVCPVEHTGGLTHSRCHTCVCVRVKRPEPKPYNLAQCGLELFGDSLSSRDRKGATFHLPLELHQGQERRSNYTTC